MQTREAGVSWGAPPQVVPGTSGSIPVTAALGLLNVFSAVVSSLVVVEGLPLVAWLGLHWTLVVDNGHYTGGAYNLSVLAVGIASTLLECFALLVGFRRIAGPGSTVRVLIANLASAEMTWLSIKLVSPF